MLNLKYRYALCVVGCGLIVSTVLAILVLKDSIANAKNNTGYGSAPAKLQAESIALLFFIVVSLLVYIFASHEIYFYKDAESLVTGHKERFKVQPRKRKW
jgi:hypothetical protein